MCVGGWAPPLSKFQAWVMGKGGHRTSATLLRALDTIRQQQERIHIHSILNNNNSCTCCIYVQENITSERTSAVTKTMNCVCVCVCV